jgi:hypothetical protein
MVHKNLDSFDTYQYAIKWMVYHMVLGGKSSDYIRHIYKGVVCGMVGCGLCNDN